MADEIPKDQESAVVSVGEGPAEQTKKRRALSGARRVLTEDELAAPAARVMLLDELDRLETEKAELSQYRSRFHETDKECAVLKERGKARTAVGVLSTVTVALGGTLLGAALSMSGSSLYLSAAVGSVLLLMGALAPFFGQR